MSYIGKPMAQGEITFYPVSNDHFAAKNAVNMMSEGGYLIVAHSETGHHHVLDPTKVDASIIDNPPSGMSILRLIVKEPTEVKHLRGYDTHAPIKLAPGLYEARTAREYDPYGQMARRVAD